MNSLIGLGAMTSFVAGLASPMAPDVAFDTSFLEEPVMLLAFVLLGRSLEARARLKASGIPPPTNHHLLMKMGLI
jgi:cation transport ATPase